MITLANEASTVDLIQDGWIMAHQLHQQRQIVQQHIGHNIQRVLYGWKARLAGEVITRKLLLFQMRRVVGADSVNQAVVQSLEQSLLVAVRLDGRIALDSKTLILIIVVVEA